MNLITKFILVISVLILVASCSQREITFYEIQSTKSTVDVLDYSELESFANDILDNPAKLSLNAAQFQKTVREKIKVIDEEIYGKLEHDAIGSGPILSHAILHLQSTLKKDKSVVELSRIDVDENTIYFVVDYLRTFEVLAIKLGKCDGKIAISDAINLKNGFSDSDISVYNILNSKAKDAYSKKQFEELAKKTTTDEIINWGFYDKDNVIDSDDLNHYVVLKTMINNLSFLKKEKRKLVLEKYINKYSELTQYSSLHELLLAKVTDTVNEDHIKNLESTIGQSEKLRKYIER